MQPSRITIEVDLSRQGLLEARDAIDTLLEQQDRPANPFTQKVLVGQANRKVGEVWSRIGPKTRGFLIAAANHSDDDEDFTMQDIAQALEVPAKTVRSWHRNLGRTLRQVDEVMPEPRLLLSRYDGNRNRYRLPAEVREAILARAESA